MSRIADPLREYADVVRKIIELPHLVYVDDTLRERLLEIADQIDREHERRMDQGKAFGEIARRDSTNDVG